MFLLRDIEPEDLPCLLAVAAHLNTVNLPNDFVSVRDTYLTAGVPVTLTAAPQNSGQDSWASTNYATRLDLGSHGWDVVHRARHVTLYREAV